MTTCVLWVILLSQNWAINFEHVNAIDNLRPFKFGRKKNILLVDVINILATNNKGADQPEILHYANMSVQYTAIFHGCINDNFQMKFFDIFLNFAQNIDCGYTLEPPQRGGSNEGPQSMFWSKNKKNIYTRVNPTFSI